MKKIVFSLLICALLLSACATTLASKTSETATLTPHPSQTPTQTATQTITPAPTLTETPTVTPTETPVVQETITFKDKDGNDILDADGKPLTVDEYHDTQKALDAILAETDWFRGDEDKAIYSLMGDNKEDISFLRLFQKIPGFQFYLGFTLPHKSEPHKSDNFFPITLVEVDEGTFVFFKEKGKDVAIFIDKSPSSLSEK
ncbi:MAG: hypothetical protein WA821_16265 [Anaerolineales bacterium]